MEKIFIDTDVLLDVLLNREPHVKNSSKILAYIEKNLFKGYTSSLILSNCYYIISSNINHKLALNSINKLRSILTILPYTDKEIGESINSSFNDFEDGVEYFIAVNNGINTIITRNIKDFKKADCNVFMPTDFLCLKEVKKLIEKEQE